MEKQLKQFLKKYEIDKSWIVYVVAFSGGFDSMFLLDLLRKTTKNKIIAIHLNHNWRKKECDIEENNCRIFCDKIGVEFYSEKLSDDVAHTETAARDARYEFFERCSKKFHSGVVFTAHNKNDNAETVLYRIFKGTGVAGLSGIREHRGIFYRPILNVSRCDIENYCKINNLKPNCDSSNLNTKYKRNYIRNILMPEIIKEFPNAIDALNSLSCVAQEETIIIEQCIDDIFEKNFTNNKFKMFEFLNLSDALQKRIIYRIFQEYNLEYDREKVLRIWNFIKDSAKIPAGKTISLNSNLYVFANATEFEILNKTAIEPKIKEIIDSVGIYNFGEYRFTIEKYNKHTDKFPREDENFAIVNLENFEMNFTLRNRETGDIIQPFGMMGTKKLKKYLIEKHVPNHRKNELILLACGNEILWVPGFGISDKIKVLEKPTHILKLEKR